MYLGCDWENVPLHLPSTFTAWDALSHNGNVRMAMLGQFGLTWPWESLHREALAWYDHWLKGADTGIMDGPPVRYVLPGSDSWHAADAWPPEVTYQQWALRVDGELSVDEGQPGAREYLMLGRGPQPRQAEPDRPPVVVVVDVGTVARRSRRPRRHRAEPGGIGHRDGHGLDGDAAGCPPDGEVTDVTAGWLRAGLRAVDEDASSDGSPVLPCAVARAVPPGEDVVYRIPLPNARRIGSGHRVRLVLTSDDQDPSTPTIMNFRHASVGTSSVNTVGSASRLLLPVLGRNGVAVN